MPRPNNRGDEKHAIQERQNTISKLYVKGMTQHEIAKKLGVSQTSVCFDLKHIRAQWIEASIEDYGIRVGRELAKLDHIEVEAWQAWERSTSSLSKGGSKRTGDARFLEIVSRTVETRLKILGAFKRHEGADENPALIAWDKMFEPLQPVDPMTQELGKLGFKPNKQGDIIIDVPSVKGNGRNGHKSKE